MHALTTSLRQRGGRSRLAAGIAAAALAALAVAGCGSVGGTKPYTEAATKACLEETGVKLVPVDTAVDFVASSALGGSLAAKLELNRVTISFGRDAVEGGLIQKAYAKYGSKDVPIDQVLELRRNAVLLWAGVPSKQDADVVRSCLKTA